MGSWIPYALDIRKASAEDSKKILERVHFLLKCFNQSNVVDSKYKTHTVPVANGLGKVIEGMGYSEKLKGYKADYDLLASYTDKVTHMSINTSSEEKAAIYGGLLMLSAKYMKQLPQPAKGYASTVELFGKKLPQITGMFMHTNNLDPELKSMYENFLAGRAF